MTTPLTYKVQAYIGREFHPVRDCVIVRQPDGSDKIVYWNPSLGKEPTKAELDALSSDADKIFSDLIMSRRELDAASLRSKLSALEAKLNDMGIPSPDTKE
jgi:hypothetical protein